MKKSNTTGARKPRADGSSRFRKFRHGESNRKPIYKFLGIFTISLCGFSFILQQDAVQTAFVSPHLNQVAWVCGKVLRTLGTQCEVYESSIVAARFSVQVIKGCESIYPTAMLWAALLAYPAAFGWKISGLIGGALILFLLNIFRVITMFYIGVYLPSLFDIIHIYAWQALFILVTLAVFLFWAVKAAKPHPAA